MALSDITDGRLADLEQSIRGTYNRAWEEVREIERAYFEDFERRDSEMKTAIDNGTYPIPPGMTPEQYYARWRLNQIGRDERWIAIRNRMVDRMVDADKICASYITDTTAGIYTMNANYTAYEIEDVVRRTDTGNGTSAGVAFDIVDENTVQRLVTEDNLQLFPIPRVDVPAGRQWHSDVLQRTLTSSILQGLSIPRIAAAFRRDADMAYNSSIRAARTAFTGAQNAGRVSSYKKASAMGIDCKKQWMSTLDDRTRSSHQQLDGVRVGPGERFEGHGLSAPLEYPGDSSGAPCDVWNCRCTLVGVIPGLNDDRGSFARRAAYTETDENDPERQYKTYETLSGYTYRGEDGTEPYLKWLNNKLGIVDNEPAEEGIQAQPVEYSYEDPEMVVDSVKFEWGSVRVELRKSIVEEYKRLSNAYPLRNQPIVWIGDFRIPNGFDMDMDIDDLFDEHQQWNGVQGLYIFGTKFSRMPYIQIVDDGYTSAGSADEYLTMLTEVRERRGWNGPRDNFFNMAGNVGSVLMHEYGHAVARDCEMYGSFPKVQQIVDLFNATPKSEICRQLSNYASTNYNEMVAEAFVQSFAPESLQSDLCKQIMHLIHEARGD